MATCEDRLPSNGQGCSHTLQKWKLEPKDSDKFAGQFFGAWSKSMGVQAKDFLEREQIGEPE